jgi:hypothetical protein
VKLGEAEANLIVSDFPSFLTSKLPYFYLFLGVAVLQAFFGEVWLCCNRMAFPLSLLRRVSTGNQQHMFNDIKDIIIFPAPPPRSFLWHTDCS